MDIAISIVAKIAEYTVRPILRHARTIINPQYIIQETREEQKRLQERQDEVNDHCEQAKLDGKEIKESVNVWLKSTQDALTEVEQWLHKSENETNASACCASKWFLVHKQCKDAKQRKEKLRGKINEGQKLPNDVSYLDPPTGITLLPGTGFIKFDSVKTAFDKIMEFLRKNQGKIGIYGMGGVGKTSLVKEAYEEAEKEKLFCKVVVTVVSQAPDIIRIQAELGEQLDLRYLSPSSKEKRATQLKNRMKHEDTILVVLDDVWSQIDLATIGIDEDHQGCKVIITTRDEQVCSKMKCAETIYLLPLTPSESWDLFKSHASNTLSDPCEFEDVAKQVAEECGELPLALIVVASALNGKSKEGWELALYKLKNSLAQEFEGIGEKVYASIKLSYDFLTSEITKRCFLMCSLFPEDYHINVEAITGYALGYNFLGNFYNTYTEARQEVDQSTKNLLAYNLLMRADSVSERRKMHDVVRDAALWIVSEGEEIFLVPIPSHDNWTNDKRLSNATTISLLSCPMNKHLPSLTEYPRLKMLLMAQRIPLPNVLIDTCFKRLTSLHVLDMSQVSSQLLELELPSSFESLCNLRALYLRRWILKGNMSVIGSFKYLRILSFAGSQIDNLPVELKELTELTFLDLSACKPKTEFDQEVLSHLINKVTQYHPPKKQLSDLIYDEE